MGESQPQPVVMYRVTLKDASGRVGGSATTVVVPDGTQKPDDTHHRPPQLFRFRVRTADGKETVSPIAIGVPADLKISDLRWGNKDLDHGSETTLHAKVARYHGEPLRFVVEHNHDGAWSHYATVPATVANGKAEATLRVHHPVLPPVGQAPAPSKIKDTAAARLRFRLERGAAPPQPRAQPVPVRATSTPPAVKFSARNLRWAKQQHDHGADTIMHARVSGQAGQPVRFVVEHYAAGSWKHYATVPATVKGSEAIASLSLHHPVLPPTGPQPTFEQVEQADPAKMRFKVELGPASPQPRLEPRKAPAPPVFSASQLSWAKQEHDHGNDTTMRAKVSGHRGKPVRFVVEHYAGGTWKPYATVPAVIKGDEATAPLRVHHPVLPPVGPEPTFEEVKNAEQARLRFKVELGTASPQPPAAPRQAPLPPVFSASALSWEKQRHDHGSEAVLRATVSGHAGKPVRFVVEHYSEGSWRHYATVPAVIKGDQATANLPVRHPLAGDPAQLKHADPATLRFKVEPGTA